jgi:hypothetical protein
MGSAQTNNQGNADRESFSTVKTEIPLTPNVNNYLWTEKLMSRITVKVLHGFV